MKRVLKRFPEICEVWSGHHGVRWVVVDAGDDTFKREHRRIKLRRLGSTGVAGVKTITAGFFLATYAFVGVFGSDIPTQQPQLPPVDKEGRRAWNMCRLRRERGYSLAHMSRTTGIGSTFITEMETGRRAISIKTVDRLAAGLELEPSAVLAELDRG